MKLLASLTSPYARKVRIVLAEKRIEYQLVKENAWNADSTVPQFNPLGKVPVLVLDDGSSLFDSRVIVEFLDTVTPVSRLIPTPTRQRIAVKRWEALGDGICDAASTVVLERKRVQSQQNPEWIERQYGKVHAGLKAMAQELGEKTWCTGDSFNLADISAGCALAYLAFRFPEIHWNRDYPNLMKFADKIAKRQSFRDTVPVA
ncbi:MAG: glutathione S-transferase [Burkholderiales bacterium]